VVEPGTEKTNKCACPIQAMADLFLRYLRFLLFNPKPVNQQEETEITEKGKQKLKGGGGGRAVVEQGTEKTNKCACPIQAMADLFLCYLRFLLFNPKPMNQQEQTEITEKEKQKLKGGRRWQGGFKKS